MTRRHDERYARALARITPQRAEATAKRVVDAIAASKNTNLPQNFAKAYTRHKLGIRKGDKT